MRTCLSLLPSTLVWNFRCGGGRFIVTQWSQRGWVKEIMLLTAEIDDNHNFQLLNLHHHKGIWILAQAPTNTPVIFISKFAGLNWIMQLNQTCKSVMLVAFNQPHADTECLGQQLWLFRALEVFRITSQRQTDQSYHDRNLQFVLI